MHSTQSILVHMDASPRSGVLRDIVLDGTTRVVLRSMTCPALPAH